MPTYTIPAANGDHTFRSLSDNKQHDIALSNNGTPTAGTITLTARKPGSDIFETIPDANSIPLTNLHTIQFFGAIAEYKATVSAIAGSVIQIKMTDTVGG